MTPMYRPCNLSGVGATLVVALFRVPDVVTFRSAS